MKIKYEIIGLACPNCAAKVEKIVAERTGAQVKVNFLTESLTVEAEAKTPELDRAVREGVHAFSPELTVNDME